MFLNPTEGGCYTSVLGRGVIETSIKVIRRAAHRLMVGDCLGFSRIVSILLSNGAKTLMSRDDGYCPSPVSSHWGHVAVTALLVEAGAALEAMNGEGATPLLLAAATGRSEVVNVLIDAGAVHGRRKRL